MLKYFAVLKSSKIYYFTKALTIWHVSQYELINFISDKQLSWYLYDTKIALKQN